MAKRTYGQYCGVARALEMVGERWALLIVRDLLVGPKRFTDLLNGLSGIPTNILTARLKEMEEAGVVRRRLLAGRASLVVYELTEYGKRLEDVVLAMGRWGAQSLGTQAADEIITTDSMIMAFRTIFVPEAAVGVSVRYQLHFGPMTIHVILNDGMLTVGAGLLDNPDLVIRAIPAFREMLAREITPQEAVDRGIVRIEGPQALLDQFSSMFLIAARPATPWP